MSWICLFFPGLLSTAVVLRTELQSSAEMILSLNSLAVHQIVIVKVEAPLANDQ